MFGCIQWKGGNGELGNKIRAHLLLERDKSNLF